MFYNTIEFYSKFEAKQKVISTVALFIEQRIVLYFVFRNMNSRRPLKQFTKVLYKRHI